MTTSDARRRRGNRRRNGAARAGRTPRRSRVRPARWIGLGILALAAGAGAYWLGHEAVERMVVHPALAVDEVRVVGTARTSPEELVELADIAAGDPWLALDAAAVEMRLCAHPWVARARVRRPWPGRVVLRVEECVPIARVEIAGRLYGLCEDLRIVPSADSGLPLLSLVGKRVDPDDLARGVAYSEFLERYGVDEPLRMTLDRRTDRIELPERGFVATVEGRVPAEQVAGNVAAFLEKLDAEGASRGTLRIISGSTAVWKAT